MLTQEERAKFLKRLEDFEDLNTLPPYTKLNVAASTAEFRKILESEFRLFEALQKAEEGLMDIYEATKEGTCAIIVHRTLEEIKRIKEGKT